MPKFFENRRASLRFKSQGRRRATEDEDRYTYETEAAKNETDNVIELSENGDDALKRLPLLVIAPQNDGSTDTPTSVATALSEHGPKPLSREPSCNCWGTDWCCCPKRVTASLLQDNGKFYYNGVKLQSSRQKRRKQQQQH